MVLEIYLVKRYALEKAYRWKVWRRTKRLVLLGREKGYGVGLWKSIRKEKKKGIFKTKTRFKVGNERKIKFWHDVWCDDISLKDSFSSLSTIATSKEEWVGDVQYVEGEMVTWNLCLSRNFHDWAMNTIKEFFSKTL